MLYQVKQKLAGNCNKSVNWIVKNLKLIGGFQKLNFSLGYKYTYMSNMKILWVDDEIDLLKPHILFLEQKSYSVDTCSNGADALDKVTQNQYVLFF